jgi:hypothetical protein
MGIRKKGLLIYRSANSQETPPKITRLLSMVFERGCGIVISVCIVLIALVDEVNSWQQE